MNRRDMLVLGGGAAASVCRLTSGRAGENSSSNPQPAAPFRVRYCLNSGTVRGHNLSVVEEIELAASAGYDGIEPWTRNLLQYKEQGGSLSDLRKRIADHGLRVESAIGFAQWIVDDEQQRQKGLEEARRDMELVSAIGGTRIAAPPAGASGQDAPKLDLFAVAERYGALLDVGQQIGVTPQVEVWGPSKNLSRLGESVFVAVESGHPEACVLPDVYHIYRGGSDFAGLGLLSGSAIHCFHMNDYPAGPPRESLTDADRVYPGDGDGPLDEILQTLHRMGFSGALSLELFNRDYWMQPAADVARTGLAKMKNAVARAVESPPR
ncbi:MAG: sugar phosphate isomerase/epimerase [Planctomycetaceae bacterium]|nr:sugar phosphate isomerase/epimerase [Planctomycetaceae bacterium]